MKRVNTNLRDQGIYYVLTGIWPLVHLKSFAKLSGKKPDPFQTRVTALLFAAIGLVLIVGSRKRRPEGEAVLLSVAAASAAMASTISHKRKNIGLLVDLIPEGMYAYISLHELRRRMSRRFNPSSLAH